VSFEKEKTMREIQIPIPEIGLIALTRGALGIGIGLLIADRLSCQERKAAGLALVAVGALTTIPLAIDIFGRRRSALAEQRTRSQREPQVAGTYGI
jgi:hypothetical protein